MTKKKNHQDQAQYLWAVGWMSFFWSVGTVMVASILPTFLTEELHISHKDVGILEGMAIFAMYIAKIFSGITSDMIKNRKPLIGVGSSLTIVVKCLFALSQSFMMIFWAKCLDRLSKGIRSAPTEALVADLSTEQNRGKSYGLRQTLYPLGVVFGSLITTFLMKITNDHYRVVFWLSAIPGVISLIILIFFIKQPKVCDELLAQKSWKLIQLKELPRSFWEMILVTGVLMLARFSETFLNLRAKDLGWQIGMLPLLFVAYDLMHAFVAYPIGVLADRVEKRKLFFIGLWILVMANIVLIFSIHWIGVLFGVLLVGLHMGMTQGLIATMIAHSAPASLRGTAFAIYYFFAGIFGLLGNMIAGSLSQYFGTKGAFMGGCVFTLLSIAALSWFYRSYFNKTIV